MNKAIICVDDEAMILNSLKSQLYRCFGGEYVYETAMHATEAMEIIDELKQEDFNILAVVSDWLMPGIKGDEFLIEVHKRHPEVVTMLLTGQADERAVENAREHANLFACISKPWSEDVLIETIERALKMKHSG